MRAIGSYSRGRRASAAAAPSQAARLRLTRRMRKAKPGGYHAPMSEVGAGRVDRALRDCEDGIRQQATETVVAFDGEGVELLSKAGDLREVVLSDQDVERMRGAAVITHNHPAGTAFSDTDVALACALEVAELRVVSKHWTHRMRVPGGTWNATLWDSGLEESIRRWFHEVRRRFNEEIGRGKLTIEDANVEFWHDVWTRVAQEIGLEYERVGAGE